MLSILYWVLNKRLILHFFYLQVNKNNIKPNLTDFVVALLTENLISSISEEKKLRLKPEATVGY